MSNRFIPNPFGIAFYPTWLHFPQDLDKIDMYVQSLDYEKKYPQKDLSEFRRSAVSKIQTVLGKAIINDIEK